MFIAEIEKTVKIVKVFIRSEVKSPVTLYFITKKIRLNVYLTNFKLPEYLSDRVWNTTKSNQNQLDDRRADGHFDEVDEHDENYVSFIII